MARPGLYMHRKFLRLERALGGRALAAGVLELLWAPAYETGDAYLGDADDIAARVGWDIDNAEALTVALRDAGGAERSGFIDPIDDQPGQYRIHDLADHAPIYMHRRAVMESERSVTKACVRCETPFHSPDPKAKFCSTACRSAAWRERNKNAGAYDAPPTDGDAECDAENAPERSVTNANATLALAPALALAPKKEEKTPAPQAALVSVPPTPRFDFDALYALYPRKRGRDDGIEYLKKIVRSDGDYEQVKKAITNLAAEVRRDGTEEKHIPYFGTFFGKKGRWRDYLDATPPPGIDRTVSNLTRLGV